MNSLDIVICAAVIERPSWSCQSPLGKGGSPDLESFLLAIRKQGNIPPPKKKPNWKPKDNATCLRHQKWHRHIIEVWAKLYGLNQILPQSFAHKPKHCPQQPWHVYITYRHVMFIFASSFPSSKSNLHPLPAWLRDLATLDPVEKLLSLSLSLFLKFTLKNLKLPLKNLNKLRT